MRIWMMVLALLALARPVLAQAGPNPERLREQVVQRFMENYRVQAGLTDEQYAKLQTVVRRSWEERRTTQERERGLVTALEGQMRPGVAADEDSVTTLLDGLLDVQTRRVELARAEQREFAQFLNPIQRAQLVLAFARLERQIEQIIQRRMEAGPPQRMRNP